LPLIFFAGQKRYHCFLVIVYPDLSEPPWISISREPTIV
jgi:hypothetical protein